MKTLLAIGLFSSLVAGPPPPATPPAPGGDDVFPSNLMVDQDVTVSCHITGIIDQIHVDRGSVVTKGQPLATLNLGEFDADVKQTKESMELAKAQLDRTKALSAQNVISKADLDTARAQYNVAVANWERAKAIREYAVIRAPFNGVVAEKYARLGQKVTETGTQPLFKIVATEPLLARIYVREQDLLKVRKGDRVDVVPDSFPSAKTTGSVQFISPNVDPASGTFQVVVAVHREPTQTVLRPGVAVKVYLSSSRRQ
ncbi:MAG TPA: efflux RND transporter periplasmic adaptor subunit [Thermoanaerobaculia bacterium]|nr:efflux RND transporter periplasmic adaptor subunit [Thermoanaerobaculia bacterium]